MYVLSDALNVTLLVLAIVFGVIAAGVAVLFVVFRMRDKKAKKGADDILKEAKIKAEHLVKGAQLDAKQAAFEIRQQAENEARARKAEVAAEEQKLSLRQDAFETRENALLEKDKDYSDLMKKNLSQREP
jgi:ribonuclease Y